MDFFLNRGHSDIMAFTSQANMKGRTADERAILQSLRDDGFLSFTPARQFKERNIKCEEDLFILDYSVEGDRIIVSRDNFRFLNVSEV